MKLNQIPFKATGESVFTIVFGLFTLACILFFTIGLAIFSEKFIGHFIGVGLTLLLALWLKRLMKTVDFDLDKITVTYLYGNKKTIQYSQLKKFYKNQEGFAPIFVYVIKFEEGNKLKKITFWDSDIDEEELKKELMVLKNDRTLIVNLYNRKTPTP
ncbi:MAG: hypothetical protein ACSHXL_02710 [Bacteroidota bacterium]